jgi:hypothetical protein
MGLLTGLAIGGMVANGVMQTVGAHKAASAAKDVAKMQTDAADKASAINDDVYAPYVRAGRSTLSTLSRLTTPGAGARYAAADPTLPAPQPGPMAGGRPRPQGAPTTGSAMPRGTLGAMARPQAPRMVMMEAPDGSGVRPVPESEVARFEQAGAKRVQ